MKEMGLVGGNGFREEMGRKWEGEGNGEEGEEGVFLFPPFSFLSLVRFFSFLVSESSSLGL